MDGQVSLKSIDDGVKRLPAYAQGVQDGEDSQQRILWMAMFVPGLDGRRGLPYVLVGDPGTVKTSRVRHLARRAGLPFESVLGSIRQPVDFMGCPIPQRMQLTEDTKHLSPDGGSELLYMHYAPAGFGVRMAEAQNGVLLFDEANNMPLAVQSAMLRVLFEGVVGELQLPPGVRMFLATNEIQDAAGGHEISRAMATRMGWLEWEKPSVDQFGAYLASSMGRGQNGVEAIDFKAEERAVDERWDDAWGKAAMLVYGFLRARGALYHKKPKQVSERAWPNPRCYTSDTEVMTRRGWVAWPDVQEGDTFATRDPDGAVSYEKAVEFVRVPYGGELIRFKARSVDLSVTPNHNMLFRRSWTGGSKPLRGSSAFVLAPAEVIEEELRAHTSYAIRIPCTASWEDRRFPELPYITIGGERRVSTAAWAELVGWVLTDGYVSKPGKQRMVSVTQVRASSRDRVAKLFLTCGFTPSRYDDRVRVTDAFLHDVFSGMGGGKHDGGRRVPRSVMDAGSSALRGLLAGAFGGDGWWTKTGGRKICVGPNRGLASDLQEAALRLGNAASVRTYIRRGRKIYTTSIYANQRHSLPKLTAQNVSRVPYSGEVHCARVPPNHTLLVRQNGYAVWSGNTWDFACHALAGSFVYELSQAERQQAVAAYVGSAAYTEFYTYAQNADLPDPELLLDGKVEFVHNPSRLDRTAAVLSGCTAKVLPEGAEKREARIKALWLLIKKLPESALDIAVPHVRQLSQANTFIGNVDAWKVLKNLGPVVDASKAA